MFGIGMTELMVILVIGLLVLGPKRLPELARSLGRGLAEFRRASLDIRREFSEATEEAKIAPEKLPGPPEKPTADAASEPPPQPAGPGAAASAPERPGRPDSDG